MQCPKCKSENNTIIDTRKYKSIVSRVRHCEDCDEFWSTKENIDKELTHKGFQNKARIADDDNDKDSGLFDK